jgi:transposase
MMFSEEEQLQIEADYLAGMSLEKIKDKWGCSLSAAYRYATMRGKVRSYQKREAAAPTEPQFQEAR